MDKKEIEIILLGIVAIIAIVGLVLMFNSKMTGSETEITGQATGQSQAAICAAQTPDCWYGVPRTPKSQYLDPYGYLHVTCSCFTPAIEDMIISVKII